MFKEGRGFAVPRDCSNGYDPECRVEWIDSVQRRPSTERCGELVQMGLVVCIVRNSSKVYDGMGQGMAKAPLQIQVFLQPNKDEPPGFFYCSGL